MIDQVAKQKSQPQPQPRPQQLPLLSGRLEPSTPPSDTITHALSICEPWAWAIVAGFKSVENRTWATPHRGRFAVHASLSQRWLRNTQATINQLDQELIFRHKLIEEIFYNEDIPEGRDVLHPGCLVGSVEVVDCITRDLGDVRGRQFAKYAGGRGPMGIPHHTWAGPSVCWVLASPHRYERPIFAKGKLQLWTLDQEQQAAVVDAESNLLHAPADMAFIAD